MGFFKNTPLPPPPIICLNGDFRAPSIYVIRHNCCYRMFAVAVITWSTSVICQRNSILNHVDPLSVDDLHIVKDKQCDLIKIVMKYQNITSLS